MGEHVMQAGARLELAYESWRHALTLVCQHGTDSCMHQFLATAACLERARHSYDVAVMDRIASQQDLTCWKSWALWHCRLEQCSPLLSSVAPGGAVQRLWTALH